MLTWTCEKCGRPIADGAGYLTLNEADAARFPEKLVAWQAQAIANNPPLLGVHGVIGGADLLDYPDPVHWEVLHAACDPNPDRGDYWIAVERIRTAASVLRWTAHLWDKDWLMHTDWDALLQRAAGQLDG